MSILPVEYASLYSLWTSTNGPNWYYSTDDITMPWNFTGEHNPCTEQWTGVTCDFVPGQHGQQPYSTVAKLTLTYMSMEGAIPSDISSLQNLTSLVLYQNSLTGNIPTTVGLLTQLTAFDIATNILTGALPTEIGYLNNLQKFIIGTNHFDKTLPSEIGLLTQLTMFDVSFNSFSGELPATIENLSKIIVFVVEGNDFSGPIPAYLLSNMPNLRSCWLSENRFEGALPTTISNQSPIRALFLSFNFLTGRIPTELAQLQGLVTLEMSCNNFTGSIPTEFGMLTNLTTLRLDYTFVSGNIPVELGGLTKLITLILSSTELSGPFPSALAQMTNLNQLFLEFTQMTGPIPSQISNLKQLYLLYMSSSHFSGSLPVELALMPSLSFIDLSYNSFTGSIEPITNCHPIKTVTINNNRFTGVIPSTLNLSKLEVLDISYNQLHGSLPSAISGLSNLVQLLVSHNGFTGSLDNVFNATNQKLIQTVDISSNSFTGNLPSELFRLEEFYTLCAVSNCFQGELPSNICDCTSLESLALDALSDSKACVEKISPLFAAYSQKYHVDGSIPNCIFALPNLQTLHLSGNSFSSALTNDIVVSSSLTNLDLSHNSIHGTIPSSFCDQDWEVLNLGFNKITGKLCENLYANSSVNLEVNRLSGTISSTYKKFKSISILSGNIFECDMHQTELPSNDPYNDSYSCGSDSTNVSFYLYISVALSFLVVGYMLYYNLFPKKDSKALVKEYRKSVLASKTVTEENVKEFSLFELMCKGLIRSIAWLLLPFGIGIIVSSSLHSKYTTYTDSYVWKISFGLLSGVGAAVVMIFYQFGLAWAGYYILGPYQRAFVHVLLERSASVSTGKSTSFDLFKKDFFRWSLADASVYAILFLTNLVVTISANAGFVTSSIDSSGVKLFFLQVALALFKFIWTNLVINKFVPYTLQRATTEVNSRHESLFRTTLNLFAILVAPCVATMIGSPECFHYIFFPTTTISVEYSYPHCDKLVLQEISRCFYDVYTQEVVSYDPKFTYSYECSSALMIAYSSVFMYQVIFSSYLAPLVKLLCRPYQRRLKESLDEMSSTKNTCYSRALKGIWAILDVTMPMLDTSVAARYDQQIRKCYNPTSFGSSLVTFLVVALTFGCVFPFLGIGYVFALIAHVAVTQMELVYYINHCEQSCREALSQAIDRVYQDFSQQLVKSAGMVLSWSGLFMSFFVFDTLGDAIGGINAFATVIVLFVVLEVSLLALSKVAKPIAFHQLRNGSNQSTFNPMTKSQENDDGL